MTEVEWESGTDPIPMLGFVCGTASDRKLRLFDCACCRRVVHLSGDDRLLLAIESSERQADGLVTADELLAAWKAADSAVWAFNGVISEQLALAAVETVAKRHTVRECARDCQRALEAHEQEKAWLPWERRSALWWSEMRQRVEKTVGEEQGHQADLLRCVIGNPFRPMAVDSRWLSSAAVSLAQRIYEERTFDRLPILAEAVQEAGCDRRELLAHCRGDTPHARGCWVIDLVLGAE